MCQRGAVAPKTRNAVRAHPSQGTRCRCYEAGGAARRPFGTASGMPYGTPSRRRSAPRAACVLARRRGVEPQQARRRRRVEGDQPGPPAAQRSLRGGAAGPRAQQLGGQLPAAEHYEGGRRRQRPAGGARFPFQRQLRLLPGGCRIRPGQSSSAGVPDDLRSMVTPGIPSAIRASVRCRWHCSLSIG